MSSILILIALVLVGLMVVRLARRKKRPGELGLRDAGTIIDLSISAYRRHLLPALLLSALCFPLGSTYHGSSARFVLPPRPHSAPSASICTCEISRRYRQPLQRPRRPEAFESEHRAG
jgi:hypothetical protein